MSAPDPKHRSHAIADAITVQQLEAEVATLRATLAQREELRDQLRAYAEYWGAIHEAQCPCDDTCDCMWKPVNNAVNVLCQAERIAQEPQEPTP